MIGVGGPSGSSQRLFVAVPLPAELLEFVRACQGLLPGQPGLRLMNAEQLHVTLAFIGEVDERKADAARSVVRSIPAALGGETTIERFLFIPTAKKARVVALAISDVQGVFDRLFHLVMSGLEAADVMRREKRPFRPHLTVARLRNPGRVQPRSESGTAPFAVESVCLYRSELRREGAVYTALEKTALTPGV